MAREMKKCILVVCVVMALISSTANAALVARYEFEGNANDSAGTNHGTLTDGASTGFDAERNSNVLNLDGIDDHVLIGDQAALNFGAADSFSISAWIKTSQTTAAPIVEKRAWTSSAGGYALAGYSFVVHQDKEYFDIEDASNNNTPIFGNTVINDNQWHHVIAVRNAATDQLLLYVDGVLDAFTEDTTSGSLTNSFDFLIGKRKSFDHIVDYHYFGGSIDDVRIYNEAIPEPATVLLLTLGAVMLRRKR